ncbi:MAG: LptF/LptG family permease [Verrucomicrobiota bacterium]
MKTLHAYLAREVLATVLMTVAVFTFVLLLGNVLKEIVELLVNRQASFFVVIKAIGFLIPYVLLFALPMGMLTATLLVFGRFSADQELTAARASGISLVALVAPVLLLSVVFSALCAWVNLELAPRGRVAYKALLETIATSNPAGMLRENQYNEFPNGWSVYARKIKNNDLKDVKVYQVYENDSSRRLVIAPTGKFAMVEGQLVLTLFEATDTQIQGPNIFPSLYSASVDLPLPKANSRGTSKISLTDMTFLQLQDQLEKLQKSFARVEPGHTNSPAELRDELRQLKKMRSDITLPVRVQINREVAFSFACIAFTLIGIPLGIRAHRRETSVGIAMALLLVLVYYSFIILAQSWDARPELAPQLIVWIPNFIFQAVGAVLLWRANKGIS